jgi:hypothetical protein
MVWIRATKGRYTKPSQWHIRKEGAITIDGYGLGRSVYALEHGEQQIVVSEVLPERGAICSKCLKIWNSRSMNDNSIQ